MTHAAGTEIPQSSSADSRQLVFTRQSPSGNTDIWLMTVGDGTARPYIATAAIETNARISPDGRWLAYQSDQSGRFEVYVQAFPNATRRWQVSVNGGAAPEWAPSGRELFYRSGTHMMTINFTAAAEPRLGAPRTLFEGDFTQP